MITEPTRSKGEVIVGSGFSYFKTRGHRYTERETPMTIPEAVEIAKHHLVQVMPDLASSTIELDELETPPAGPSWKFTFTAIRPPDTTNAGILELLRSRRSTKSVELNSIDGSLLAIRNRAA